MVFSKVIVHPIVLLSAVDHYNRIARNTIKRVVGVLLGSRRGGEIDVTNCFAVPYEEDAHDPSIWYFDFVYAEEMASMFKQVNASERVVGFYSSGLDLHPIDLEIELQFHRLIEDPIYVVIDTRCTREDLPAKSFFVEEITVKGNLVRTFKNVATVMGAIPVEEVGVEHLLRDVNDPLLSTVSQTIQAKISSLRTMEERLRLIANYCDQVAQGTIKPNQRILNNIQSILNSLQSISYDTVEQSIQEKTNDLHLTMLIASMLKSVASLYNVIQNHEENSNL